MTPKFMFPNIVTYNVSLSRMLQGDTENAFNFLSNIASKGSSPDIVTYNTYIHGFRKEGRLRYALNILNKMGDLIPNNVTYTTLNDGDCREDNMIGDFRVQDDRASARNGDIQCPPP